ncbi:MAG: succinate dehydrogenase, cytochrome b556 subunit [Gammaproteobacteria bacterium]|nr:succinate dehydrogenase, cytochrome b556 subunit [Gammaproteobacteria bacterium]
MSALDNRPIYLNLLKIRQPVTAVLSIFHRLSGIAMVLLLPGLVYLLNLSLRDQAGFDQVAGLLNSIPAKLVAVGLCWIFAHHLLAGLRFLILDFDIGVERAVARQTAWLVHMAAALIAAFSAGLLF